jgi:hypothetical protein
MGLEFLRFSIFYAACGHMFCVSCAQNDVMNVVENSKCFICMNIYNHLPRCCELIQNLVKKLKPVEEKGECSKPQIPLVDSLLYIFF